MWQERIKGILIIAVAALVALFVVRYMVAHQEELVKGVANFSPKKIEEGFLSVISRVGKKEPWEEAPAAVQIIEEKAGDLLQEIKKLPQEQIDSVKKRVLKEICEGVIEEEGED